MRARRRHSGQIMKIWRIWKKKLEMCPVGTRMPRQGVMSVTQNDFGEIIYR